MNRLDVFRHSKSLASLFEWAEAVVEIVRARAGGEGTFVEASLPQLPRSNTLSFKEHEARPLAYKRRGSGSFEMVDDQGETIARTKATRRKSREEGGGSLPGSPTNKKKQQQQVVQPAFPQEEMAVPASSPPPRKREMSLDRVDVEAGVLNDENGIGLRI